jgi:hypothetical protein
MGIAWAGVVGPGSEDGICKDSAVFSAHSPREVAIWWSGGGGRVGLVGGVEWYDQCGGAGRGVGSGWRGVRRDKSSSYHAMTRGASAGPGGGVAGNARGKPGTQL